MKMNIDSEVLRNIKCFVFDVDGVLTDGMVLALASGEQARSFNIKDGYAIERALKAGFEVAVISGGDQIGVRKRLEFLKLKHIYLGSKNKLEDLLHLAKVANISPHETVFMGDDFPDYDVLRMCGIAACPANAVPEIQEICNFISSKNGGDGAVRQLIELVMHKQGKWHNYSNENINN